MSVGPYPTCCMCGCLALHRCCPAPPWTPWTMPSASSTRTHTVSHGGPFLPREAQRGNAKHHMGVCSRTCFLHRTQGLPRRGRVGWWGCWGAVPPGMGWKFEFGSAAFQTPAKRAAESTKSEAAWLQKVDATRDAMFIELHRGFSVITSSTLKFGFEFVFASVRSREQEPARRELCTSHT